MIDLYDMNSVSRIGIPAIRRSSAPLELVRQRAQAILAYHEAVRRKGSDELIWPALGYRGPISITTRPDVFCPSVGEGSKLLAACIPAKLPVPTMLDMGTGSGIHGVIAAAQGARVVAVDIEQAACACAEGNARANDVLPAMSVRQGSLFETLSRNECFDLITFNAPFMDGVPTNALERAMFDSNHEILLSFLSGVKNHLKPSGSVLLAFSNAGDMAVLYEGIAKAGLAASTLAALGTSSIECRVFELRRESDCESSPPRQDSILECKHDG